MWVRGLGGGRRRLLCALEGDGGKGVRMHVVGSRQWAGIGQGGYFGRSCCGVRCLLTHISVLRCVIVAPLFLASAVSWSAVSWSAVSWSGV